MSGGLFTFLIGAVVIAVVGYLYIRASLSAYGAEVERRRRVAADAAASKRADRENLDLVDWDA